MKSGMADSSRPSISAVLITLNAGLYLEECLDSVSFCREVVVVDSGSTDRTLEIARAHGARVYSEAWRGFGPQKQLAIELAASDWVLSIDADERVPDDLRDEIVKAVLGTGAPEGFFIPRKNLYLGKWLRHGGQYPDYVLRLFRRGAARFTHDAVHERAVATGRTGRLRHAIEHRTFEDLSSRLSKLDRYSTLSARELHERGRRANVLSPVIHGLAFFLKGYILRLGFLDGREGLNAALLKSLGAYFKYAKLLELQDSGGRGGRT